jgi:hypothetical protein
MANQISMPNEERVTPRGRVLLFSYAFPPMQTQMTPAVVKPMAGLVRQGYQVDVLSAEPFSRYLGRDESLMPYVEKHFKNVIRLQPPSSLIGKLRLRSRLWSTTPDLMDILHRSAFDALMDLDLTRYQAVMTWSPFHSINPVVARLKRHRPGIRWIAQFSDPWAGNPLEQRILTRLWSAWQEPRTIAAADYLVHSSAYSMKLMLERHQGQLQTRSTVIPHPFDDTLFPARPKRENEKITLRYIGVLFGRRSPEPLFCALNLLLARRPDLRDRLNIELVGHVPHEMLQTSAARSLPAGTVTHVPNVSYVESLEKMYDADILLLIEADVKQNLFVPSKLSDYMGARRPIVGIAPPGGSWDVLEKLQCWRASPADIEGVSRAIEGAVAFVQEGAQGQWCDEAYRMEHSAGTVAGRISAVLEGGSAG